MDMNELLTLHETFPSLIPLYPPTSTVEGKGKRPIGDDWQKWCEEIRPFNPEDFRTCNVGIPGGPANGVIFVDVDDIVKFNKYLKDRGWILPTNTRTHLTGSGTPHYLYQYPKDGHTYGCRSVKDPEGEKDAQTGKPITVFDIKALGGQCVGPGSIHPNTKTKYSVRNDAPIAPAPEWLLDLCRQNGNGHQQQQQPPLREQTSGTASDLDSLQLSYPIKKLITEGEAKGKRSEAIMSVLNALVRAGQSDAQIISIFEAYPIGEKYHEAGHTRERWLLQQVAKVRNEKAQAGTVGDHPAKGAPTMAELREYIDMTVEGGQSFTAEDICKAFAAYRKEQKAPLYVYLSRLVVDQVLRRDPYKHGGYKKALQIPSYDMAGDTESIIFDVDLPLDLHRLIDIEPNHLISIAGSTDAGKSAFLYHVMKLNYRELKIVHFSSPEWDQNAIKKRMDAIGIERPHPNITCYPMLQGYEDLIPQEPCLVLVDYLRTSERFNELDHQYHAILRNLNGGVAFTAIQKHIGSDKPTGAQYAIHAPHHVILLDTWNDLFVCKILKTKNERKLSGYYRVFDYKNLLLNPRSREWKKGEIRWEKGRKRKDPAGDNSQTNETNTTNETNN